MTSQRFASVFDGTSPSVSLARLSEDLLAEQTISWPQLAKGVSSLETVRLRTVVCEGFTATLQFNPARIVSTGAKVDAQSIRERPCFLCTSNLPNGQKGVLTYGDFLVLCNPAPIFRGHFTISHLEHRPQLLEPFMQTFFRLARDMGPKFTVFYNGPRCGASAPDHLHFQASPSGVIPVELDSMDERRRHVLKKNNRITLATIPHYGRGVILMESSDEDTLSREFLNLIKILKIRSGEAEEPMINVLCTFRTDQWRIILFPRTKHRPDAFFREGDEQVLVSPAAVDIGGLIITPREKEFVGLNGEMIEGIFREVSVSDKVIREIVECL